MNRFNKIDSSLMSVVKSESADNNMINCIIYYNSLNYMKQYIKRTNCCEILQEYPFINAMGVQISTKNINKICSFKHINYITSVAKVFAQVNNVKKVSNLNEFYKNDVFGKGVTVAIIDTGIKNHLDFTYPSNRILFFKDFVNNKDIAYDDNGHGTFVAGVLAGNGMLSGKTYSGIAPKVNIISLKALDKNGETGAITILEAMQWIFDNKDKYNIKVVCMSFGSNPLGASDPLKLGAETLWDNGITVVAAAGNSGPEQATIKSPGISNKIITVGALDDGRDGGIIEEKNYRIADFSSRGPAFRYYKPDIIASGVDIIGTSNQDDEFYTTMSGTSVATPIIAGACALIIDKYKKITPSQVKSVLLSNTRKVTGNKNNEGFGYLYIQ